jgi:hypothetical protein
LAVVSARLGRLDRLDWGRAGEQADEDEPSRAFGLLERLLSIQSSPQRSSDDIAAGIELGRQFIAAATALWGPDDPVTLTAMNDTAALMLDDPAADVMTERASQAGATSPGCSPRSTTPRSRSPSLPRPIRSGPGR